jgi:hypothetical protein
MSMHVFPTAPSPTVTHFMNLVALISLLSISLQDSELSLVSCEWRSKEKVKERWGESFNGLVYLKVERKELIL